MDPLAPTPTQQSTSHQILLLANTHSKNVINIFRLNDFKELGNDNANI